MRNFFLKIKRGWWLYKSAGLTFFELLNLLVNKIIYFSTWGFYSTQAFLTTGKANMIVGYDRHIPKSIPKEDRKRALLAYLRRAFYKENYVGRIKYYFSNNGCPMAIARALNEMGYEVDILDNDDASFFPNKEYGIAVFHNIKLIDVYKKRMPPKTVIFYFEVVAYWRTVLEKVKKSYEDFNEKYSANAASHDFEGYKKMEDRGASYDLEINQADAKIVLGDQLVRSFFKFSNVFLTTSACLEDKYFKKDLSLENLAKGSKNFIFFGGSSHNVRKGLNLLFEAFIGTPYQLFVCSSVNDFLVDIYNLNNQPNIHLIGYQRQGAEKFYKLINSCNFVIHASRSEGIPGGVLDTMKYGLIPIVSRECNIINADNIGVMLETCTAEEIRKAIDFVSAQSPEWLYEHANLAIKETQSTYSLRKFMDDMKKAFQAVQKN